MRVLQAIIAPVGMTQEEIEALMTDEYGEEYGKVAVENMKAAKKSAGDASQKWVLFDEALLVPGTLDGRPLAAKHDVIVFSGEPQDPESAAAKAATPIMDEWGDYPSPSPEQKFRSAFYEHMYAFMDLAQATMALEGDAQKRIKVLLEYWKKIQAFLKESADTIGNAAMKMQAPSLMDAAIHELRAIRERMIGDFKSIMAGEPIEDDALKNSGDTDGKIDQIGEEDMAEIDYDKLADAVIAAQNKAKEEESAKAAAEEKNAKFVEAVAAKAAEIVSEPLKALTEKVDALKPAEGDEAAKAAEMEAQKAALRAEIDEARERLDKLENGTVGQLSSPEDVPMDAAAKAAHQEAVKNHPMMGLCK